MRAASSPSHDQIFGVGLSQEMPASEFFLRSGSLISLPSEKADNMARPTRRSGHRAAIARALGWWRTQSSKHRLSSAAFCRHPHPLLHTKSIGGKAMSDQASSHQSRHAKVFEILHQASRGAHAGDEASGPVRALDPNVADRLIQQAAVSLGVKKTKVAERPNAAFRLAQNARAALPRAFSKSAGA